MPRSRPYRVGLNQRLKDPAHAAAYLNGAKSESRDVFLLALRDVVQAHKVSKIAESAGLNRESLYRALSSRGNPSLATLDGILCAIGIEREYRVRRERKRTISFSDAKPSPEVKSAIVGSSANTAKTDYAQDWVSVTGLMSGSSIGHGPEPRTSSSPIIAANAGHEISANFILESMIAAANRQSNAILR
jgi:probable addiction module antidote protein